MNIRPDVQTLPLDLPANDPQFAQKLMEFLRQEQEKVNDMERRLEALERVVNN